MNVAVVAVGTELLELGRQDTNGDWIVERAGRLGARVRLRVQVGDDERSIVTAVRDASACCDLIVVTGGLGPTEDDRTRAALATVSGTELERDSREVDRLRSRFASRGRSFEEHQARQAERPRGASWIPNPLGTAAGFLMEYGRARIAALPGVPGEMQAMFDADVAPLLVPHGESGLARRTFRIAGRLESSVDRAIVDLYTAPGVNLTILAGHHGIDLHAVVEGSGPDAARERLEELHREIAGRIGPDLFGIDDDTLASVVGIRMRARGCTVAVAESCTGGLLGGTLTAVPGSSAWFRGGFVTYDDELKVRLAGVSPASLAAHGAVSAEVARELACGARERCGATHGVGVTGIAGPGGGSDSKPVGTVHVAVASASGVDGRSAWLPGDRGAVRGRAVALALDSLRRRLEAER